MLKLHLPLEYRLLVALDIEHLLLLLLLSRFSRVQPHRRQPTRLPRPWDSPGKNTFSNAWKWKVKVKLLSRVRLLFVTPWTVAYHAPPSMGFSRQEYWSGVPLHLTPLPKIKSKFLHVGEALWLNESDGIFFSTIYLLSLCAFVGGWENSWSSVKCNYFQYTFKSWAKTETKLTYEDCAIKTPWSFS